MSGTGEELRGKRSDAKNAFHNEGLNKAGEQREPIKTLSLSVCCLCAALCVPVCPSVQVYVYQWFCRNQSLCVCLCESLDVLVFLCVGDVCVFVGSGRCEDVVLYGVCVFFSL